MIDTLTTALANFTFLRPWWLAALALLPLVIVAQRRRLRAADGWQQAVDPHLLPYLLQGAQTRGSRGASSLLFLGLSLSVLALAGPSWRVQPAPLWQVEAPLLIALDLSSAMTATDLAPNRLAQARAKIRTLLEKRRGGQVGLLVFADDAFTVAPITRDAKTVQALLDSLSTDLMPVDGQRVDRAIARAADMLANAGFKRGEILVVSDHADGAARLAAAHSLGRGFRVSALGIGTLAGSPIANKNGFVTDSAGQVQLARLDPTSLGEVANAGGGRYAALAIDTSDLAALGVLDARGQASQAGEPEGNESAAEGGAQRVDDGYWLILAVLPLALLGFRRGWLAVLCMAQVGGVFLLTAISPAPALAAVESPAQGAERASGQGPDPQDPRPQGAPVEPSAAGEFWSRLWKRDDQRARDALERGDTERARSLAPDADLRGSAAFRGEDYAAAAQEWSSEDHADAHYNRGNALAYEGQLEEAIRAYDEALERTPGMEDAIANRKAVEDLLKQQQQQQKQDGQKQDGEQKDGEQKDGEQQDGEQQDGEQQDGEQQDGEQKDGEQKDGEQKEGEQKDGEQKEGEQKDGEQQDGEQKDGEQQDGEQQGGEQQDGEQKDGEQKDGEQKDGEQKDGEQKDGQGEEPNPDDAKAPSAAEQAEQKAAEEAARKEMQEALERAGQAGAESETGTEEAPPAVIESAEERAKSEQKQAIQQWLRRVPDDPGGLLRQKFLREYQRRRQEQGDEQR